MLRLSRVLKEHPAISFLEENNIAFETCDRFYTESENFENTYNGYCELYS